MPGFSISGKGSGPDTNNLEPRRLHRWTFTASSVANLDKVTVFLKSATRPKFSFTQDEVHRKQEVIYLAGKQVWDPVEIVFYDIEKNYDSSQIIFNWVDSISSLSDGSTNVVPPDNYKKTCELSMVSGNNQKNETWKLYNCWPAEINWNQLNYEDSGIATITVTLRYDRAVRETGQALAGAVGGTVPNFGGIA